MVKHHLLTDRWGEWEISPLGTAFLQRLAPRMASALLLPMQTHQSIAGFYFEVPECEGLEQDAAESQPLSAYIQSNGLAQAWEQSDWFRALKSEVSHAIAVAAA
jgi:hypothetical protein